MEAVVAIGLASNILQLTECGYTVIRIANELRRSGKETTRSNAETALVAKEMRKLSLKLTKDLPTSNLNQDEEALRQLAQQCVQISDKLLALLESMKVRGPGILNWVKAAIRIMREGRQRNHLQASLDNSRKQLNIQMNHMSQSDIVKKLEQALSITTMSRQDILYLKDHVQTLQKESAVDLINKTEFFNGLQKVVESPLRQIAILQSIQYPRMYERFNNVDPAHESTFDWLLFGAVNESAKHQTHKVFVDWLKGESHPPHVSDVHRKAANEGSIFHIAGKPGAGKSTLMKFLCEQEAAVEHLKTWAGEKHLICAMAFLWRLGDDEQKNLSGLKNCLIHQVLKAAPGLIQHACPSEWESDYTKTTSFDPSGTQAFDLLFRDGRAFENHKIMVFIDGLDEYKGRPTELISNIIRWAAASPTDLKICVSSREWNEFEVGFEGYPRFRIQEWTRNDIANFVSDRFGEMCASSTSVTQQDLDPLAGMITDKAEGVFLWVRVVLETLEQGVLNGDEFQDLKEKVTAYPSELNDLYQYLFDSIPELDRKKAFEALIFTHYGYTSSPRHLLQFKFLADLAKDPDFAMKLSAEPLAEEELRRCLTNTHRQVNGRCRGFLEVRSPEKAMHVGDKEVRFMHATVEEFLNQTHIKMSIERYLGDIDMYDRVCQSFFAFAKSIDTAEFFSQEVEEERTRESEFIKELSDIMGIFVGGPDFPGREKFVVYSKKRFLAFLDNIQKHGVERMQKRLGGEQEIVVQFMANNEHWISPAAQVVPILAAFCLIVEYLDNDGLCDLRTLLIDSRSRKDIIIAATYGMVFDLDSPRAYCMLEVLLRAGMSPNELPDQRVSPNFSEGIWRWVLSRLFLFGVHENVKGRKSSWWWPPDHLQDGAYQYRLIGLFLRYGAGEDFGLRFGPCYEVIGADRHVVQVLATDSDGKPASEDPFSIFVDYQLDIVQYATRNGGLLNLRQLLRYCFPHDYHHLYSLLEKWQTSDTGGDAVAPYNNSSPVDMLVLFPRQKLHLNPQYAAPVFVFKEAPEDLKECFAHSRSCFNDSEARLKKSSI
ncbi:hypothetical protein GGR54DRAFT_493072 [Hypoxylon sp. NC1633]|nr:hypothetical protein GGR54DRAFT_493072 [Hypoxylon sp. NC1633]